MNTILKHRLTYFFNLGIVDDLSPLNIVRCRVINSINYIIIIGAFVLLAYSISILDFIAIIIDSSLILLMLINVFFCKKSKHDIAINLTSIYLLILVIVLCLRGFFISGVVYLSLLPMAVALMYKKSLGKYLYYFSCTFIFTYFSYKLGVDGTIVFTYYIVTFGFYIVFLNFLNLVEQKQQELEEVIAKLENKNVELQQFNYITSHDLQEPLGTISSFSQILSSKYKDKLDEVGKASLEHIQNASNRMSTLIKGLLNYSLIGNSGIHEPIFMPNLFENIEKELKPILTSTNTVLIADDLSTIFGHKAEIQILFQQLIINAIKFRQPQINPRISIAMEKKGHFWQFSVKDNGIGIGKEYLTKIFDIFQQLHARGKYEGNGIGLSYCKKIVHLHGGNIWVESILNHGSTFYFTIKIK